MYFETDQLILFTERSAVVRITRNNCSLHGGGGVCGGGGTTHLSVQWVEGACPPVQVAMILPSTTGVKNAWMFTSSSIYVCMTWYIMK